MPNYSEIYASPKTATYANIAVVNAVKTSTASATTQQTYSVAVVLTFPQLITVTTATHAGSYIITAPITVTGTDFFGATQTDTLTLTATGGNETVSTAKAFASVTSIVVPPMNDTSGSFQFGVGDIVLPQQFPVRQLRGGAAGNIAVAYQGGITDTLPCLQGERQDVLATSVKSSGTTALPVTLYA